MPPTNATPRCGNRNKLTLFIVFIIPLISAMMWRIAAFSFVSTVCFKFSTHKPEN
jgi:hypothetical protein